ncbi:MAG: hypothetical protein AAFQ07_05225, partial [Chloroflexota bacterium]
HEISLKYQYANQIAGHLVSLMPEKASALYDAIANASDAPERLKEQARNYLLNLPPVPEDSTGDVNKVLLDSIH